jgi:translocation and assembly module TamA
MAAIRQPTLWSRRVHRSGAVAVILLLLSGCGGGAGRIFKTSPNQDSDSTQQDAAVSREPAAGAASRESAKPNAAHYRIDVEGPAELRTAVFERTLIGRWQSRAGYDPDQFEALVARAPEEIRLLAQSAGYFDARTEVVAEPGRVRIRIDAGARATVGRLDLSIEGGAAGDRSLRDRLTAAWLLPEGSFFRPDRWEQGKRALVDALGQSGYLRADIRQSRAEVDVEQTSVSLRLVVDSGPRLGIGPLRISGLKAFDARLVQDLRPFEEGEPFSIDRALLFQQRLSQVGYFTSASVLPDLDALERDPAADRVPLLVDLTESRLQRVAVGLGYSSDYGARVQLAHDHRHLFGTGWQSESVLLIETLRQRAFANVRSPLDQDSWFTGLGSSAERVDIAGERVVRT